MEETNQVAAAGAAAAAAAAAAAMASSTAALPSVQLVDGAGVFNAAGLDAFAKAVRLADCGLSYAVVAIMGPQSSGERPLFSLASASL